LSRGLKILLPIVFLLVSAAVSVVLVQSRPQALQKPVAPPTLLVDVVTVNRQPVTFTVNSQGSVTPRTETTLVSEVAGQIIEVSPAYVSGGLFDAGDVLIRIDPRNYTTQLKRARADVARARTQVATENALAGYAFEDWQRLQELNAGEGPATELALRKPQLQQALAELESAEAALDKAQGDLDRTVIRAPYDGMVREKIADVGQFVTNGAQLTRIFATDWVEVRLPLTQHDLKYLDLNKLRRGEHLPALLSAEIGGEVVNWSARIVRSEGVFDATTRVLYVVAQVADPYAPADSGEPLRVGTFVTAEISGQKGGELFVLPRHSIHRGDTVWLVDLDNLIQPRKVVIVRSDETNVYIDEGLTPGDRICTTPIDQPLPGMKVRFRG